MSRNPRARLALILAVLASLAHAQAKSVLVMRPAGANFEEARKGLFEALGPDFSLRDAIVDRSTSVDEIVGSWKAAAPGAVVAMDNRAIGLFREARSRIGDSTTPVVALMGVRVDAAVRGLPNAVAIDYEIPAVTSLVDLRSVVSTPVKRVGVVYRESMENAFRKDVEFCRSEDIELVGRMVPDAGEIRLGLAAALKDLVGVGSVDALLVLNDNALLNVALLKQVWLPVLSGWTHPVVVGVESLVRPELGFGTFAVLPDHYALGTQAAGVVEEFEQEGWRSDSARSDELISVVKIMNLRGMDGCCRFRDGRQSEIDRIMK